MAWMLPAAIVGSALLGSDAAKSAAGTQSATADTQGQNQLTMFRENKASLAPFTNAGLSAQNALMYYMGLPNTPGGVVGQNGPAGGGADWKQMMKQGYMDSWTGDKNNPALMAMIDLIEKSSSPEDSSVYGESPLSFARRTGLVTPANLGDIMSAAKQSAAASSAGAAGPGTPGTPSGFDPKMQGVLSRRPEMQDIMIDPSFDFITKTQEDALMNQRSALGGVVSGNTLRGLTDYATGAASTEFGNAYGRYNSYLNNLFTRLNTVTGTGANAAGQTAGLGANAVAQAGDFATQAANARAAGTVGSANALGGGINNMMMLSMMNKGGAGAGVNNLAFDPSMMNAGDIGLDTGIMMS